MASYFSIEVFLPLFSNSGRRIPGPRFICTRDELVDTFGGVTAFSRAPATGLWRKPGARQPVRDDIIIFEVLTLRLSRIWWRGYKQNLARRFEQQEVLVRVHKVELM